MAKTLQQLRDLIRYRCGNRSDLTVAPGLTSLDAAINDAQREIAHMYRFQALEDEVSLSSTASQRYITLSPSNIYAVLSVHDTTNDAPLTAIAGGFEEYERTVGTTTDVPTHYVRFRNRIYLRPIPNATITYNVGVYYEPTDLSGASSTSVLPQVYHDGMVILGTRNMRRSLGDDDLATAIENNEWRAFLARVRPPQALEAYSARSRGVRVRRRIHDRRLGI